MTISYYAARTNLYHLWQQHPDWDHATLAAAVGCSKGWVKKWLKRFREEGAAGIPLADILPGHSRARKHPPIKTHPLVVEQVLAIRDREGQVYRLQLDSRTRVMKSGHTVPLDELDPGASVRASFDLVAGRSLARDVQ